MSFNVKICHVQVISNISEQENKEFDKFLVND